jgi:hypothetical protein
MRGIISLTYIPPDGAILQYDQFEIVDSRTKADKERPR